MGQCISRENRSPLLSMPRSLVPHSLVPHSTKRQKKILQRQITLNQRRRDMRPIHKKIPVKVYTTPITLSYYSPPTTTRVWHSCIGCSGYARGSRYGSCQLWYCPMCAGAGGSYAF